MKLWENAPGDFNEVPQITYYKAADRKSNGAVVVFAGGGYSFRAEHEGKGYAEFLNSVGIDAFVVDYRVSTMKFPYTLLDARRGVRYVRHHAAEYGTDPSKIAVMGSSAGGHLASLISTYRGKLEFEGVDEIDNEDYLPNAQILSYPVIYNDSEVQFCFENLVGKENIDKVELYTTNLLVDDKTPPAFIWHTANDTIVNVNHSLSYASALRAKNISVELHVFPDGAHGLGLAQSSPHVAQWTNLLVNWLKYIGFLDIQ